MTEDTLGLEPSNVEFFEENDDGTILWTLSKRVGC